MQALSEQVQLRDLDEVAGALRRLARPAASEDDIGAQLEEAETMRLAGHPDEADLILSGAIHAYPRDPVLRRTWAIAPGRAADWAESLSRARQLYRMDEFDADEALRIALPIELKALQELGRWQDIPPLVEANRAAILDDPQLFDVAAETLHAAFLRQHLRALVTSAADRIGPPDEVRARVLHDLMEADRNAARLRAADARILCIGQDATGFMLTGRWGLQPARTGLGALTFFDLGGFDADAVSIALEGGLAQFLNPENYDIVPTWFGGLMPLHRPSGANFYLYRRQRWEDGDLGSFMSNLFENIERWRQARTCSQKIYLFVVTRQCDLERLSDAFRRQLGGDNARLVLLDLRDGTQSFSGGPAVSYLHRVPPAGWELNLSLLAPNPAALEFERTLIGEIIDLATQDSLIVAQ